MKLGSCSRAKFLAADNNANNTLIRINTNTLNHLKEIAYIEVMLACKRLAAEGASVRFDGDMGELVARQIRRRNVCCAALITSEPTLACNTKYYVK
jgi:hypothetical protein